MRANLTISYDSELHHDAEDAVASGDYEIEDEITDLGDDNVERIPSNSSIPLNSLIHAAQNDIPVFLSHNSERAEGNPFSHISSVSTGVIADYDEQAQPYVYNPRWTAAEADMTEKEWELRKKVGNCVVIGWGLPF